MALHLLLVTGEKIEALSGAFFFLALFARLCYSETTLKERVKMTLLEKLNLQRNIDDDYDHSDEWREIEEER